MLFHNLRLVVKPVEIEFLEVPLIIPNGPITKYLQSGTLSHVEKSKSKLHVAVTRARNSVAFVYYVHSPIVPTRFLS